MAVLAKVKLVSDLYSRTNQAVGLGKKLQTVSGKRRNSQTWSSVRVGGEVLGLTRAMSSKQNQLSFAELSKFEAYRTRI